jgi:hypothetical protein
MAAHAVDRDETTIVEVGGFPNSIVHFLRRAKVVHAIEPYAPNDYVAAIEASAETRDIEFRLHRASLADAALNEMNLSGFHLVILGLDVTAGARSQLDVARSLGRLVELIARAKSTIIEYPRYRPSLFTWEFLERALSPTLSSDISFDMSQDPVADEYWVKDQRAQRRYMAISRTALCSGRELEDLTEKYAAIIFRKANKEGEFVPVQYVLGEPISFLRGGLAEAYQGTGWAAPETRHTWTLGRESHLLLHWVDPEKHNEASDLKLTLTTRVYCGLEGAPHQRVALIVNGEEVDAVRLDQRGPIDVSFTIPRSTWDRQNPVRMTLVHPDAISPHQLGKSEDKREIALGIVSLTISRDSESG